MKIVAALAVVAIVSCPTTAVTATAYADTPPVMASKDGHRWSDACPDTTVRLGWERVPDARRALRAEDGVLVKWVQEVDSKEKQQAKFCGTIVVFQDKEAVKHDKSAPDRGFSKGDVIVPNQQVCKGDDQEEIVCEVRIDRFTHSHGGEFQMALALMVGDPEVLKDYLKQARRAEKSSDVHRVTPDDMRDDFKDKRIVFWDPRLFPVR